jgi:hypothetical protein
MTRYRRLLLGLALLLLMAGLLMLPSVHWRLRGWVKGEAFYRGRPTAYWSQEASNLICRGTGVFGSSVFPIVLYDWARTPSQIHQYLGTSKNRLTDFELLQPDQAALPVLMEMLQDSRPQVRLVAAQALLHFELDGKPAVAALLPLYDDPDDRVRRMARQAVHQINLDKVTESELSQ